MSIATELTLLANSKQAIKNSINQKGGNITDSTPLADYSTAIDNLPSGGSGNPLIESIDVSDFTGTTFNRVANYTTDVTIPSGVTELGYEAFYQCVRLTSITLPNTLNRINQRAFMGCSSLQTINIPNTVTTIYENAFAESGLTSFSMPMGITNSNNIGSSLLSNCKNLTSVDFGNINEIRGYMCYGCTSLTAITIPSTVTSIANQAFTNCTGLTSVIIPDNVTFMESCFYQCTNLKYVTIGTGLQYFRGTTFMGCSSLVSITIKATTPPEMNNTNSLLKTNNCPIYVPAESVDAYKAANNWSTYADRIQAIPAE